MPSQLNIFDGLIVDNFAGGGGASTGIELAVGRPVDIAINHDPSAIAMHKVNHPHTKHYCESVWEVDPREATQGKPVALAWFSPDCKHFSKAKGGKPVSKEIRGLAWVAVRWAATVRPHVIILENVEEFKTWCPVKNGIIIKKQSGKTFVSFVNALRKFGYTVDWRELRACDYGAPTIRKRLFLIARCDGQPIRWPEPTHGQGKLPYRTAAEIIDWSLPCPSIFDTAEEIWQKYKIRSVRPLADATLRRIARGLKKFVFDNPEPFIVRVNHADTSANCFRGQQINEPLGTLTASNEYGIITPKIAPFTRTGTSGSIGQPADEPVGTIRAAGNSMLVVPMLTKYHKEKSVREVRGQTVDEPLLTTDTSNRFAVVSAFMSKYYSGGHQGNGNAVTEPLNTITAIDHNALVTTQIVKYKGDNIGQPVTEPIQTITADGNHFGEVRVFLVKYYGAGIGQTADESLHTITSKDRLGLVTVHGKQCAIVDIGLRMLTPRELFAAQGFPPDYVIDVGPDGEAVSKSAQVARCGNAVPPPFAEALVRANLPEMCCPRLETMRELKREMVA
ncbi:MAG: DNA cytosine methyltransferase [Chitinispirillia bacterium]|nr:DNA cytosine methyltransferase [Chitinispirillia bacterium]